MRCALITLLAALAGCAYTPQDALDETSNNRGQTCLSAIIVLSALPSGILIVR